MMGYTVIFLVSDSKWNESIEWTENIVETNFMSEFLDKWNVHKGSRNLYYFTRSAYP